MNKKIFKTLGAGLKLFVERNEEILIYFAILISFTVSSTWIVKILDIPDSNELTILVGFIVILGSAQIGGLLIHCKEAVKYSNEMKCTMEEAWKATTSPEPDEDF